MADLNHKEVPDTKQSNPEAQSRINEVANKAIQIIENNPKIEEILRESLKKNILDVILKNPMMVQKVLDEVDRRFKERLEKMPASERLKAIQGYVQLTVDLGNDLASATYDVKLATEIQKAKTLFDEKIISIKREYHEILTRPPTA